MGGRTNSIGRDDCNELHYSSVRTAMRIWQNRHSESFCRRTYVTKTVRYCHTLTCANDFQVEFRGLDARRSVEKLKSPKCSIWQVTPCTLLRLVHCCVRKASSLSTHQESWELSSPCLVVGLCLSQLCCPRLTSARSSAAGKQITISMYAHSILYVLLLRNKLN